MSGLSIGYDCHNFLLYLLPVSKAYYYCYYYYYWICWSSCIRYFCLYSCLPLLLYIFLIYLCCCLLSRFQCIRELFQTHWTRFQQRRRLRLNIWGLVFDFYEWSNFQKDLQASWWGCLQIDLPTHWFLQPGTCSGWLVPWLEWSCRNLEDLPAISCGDGY